MSATEQSVEERLVRVKAGSATIEGNLNLPEGARAVVLFAHGSGSSRFSSRNRYVARVLNEAKLATLLIDLLTSEEEAIDQRTAHLRFDIRLLAGRLVSATDWLTQNVDTRHLSIGYFGASTGAAAALVAAAERPEVVHAVVSRGGRPDLAGAALPRVRAPTLLIVGGDDVQVIELNRAALALLRCEKQLVIIPGASHLFEEPGALDEVARLARECSGSTSSRMHNERPNPEPLRTFSCFNWRPTLGNQQNSCLSRSARRRGSARIHRYMSFREYPRLHRKLGSSYRFNGLAFGIENRANSAISVVPQSTA